MLVPTLPFFRHLIPRVPGSPQPGSVSIEECVYFYWWLYLRENQDYRECCISGGRGPKNLLYKDFGDVFATTPTVTPFADFEAWWRDGDRSRKLFADPPAPLRTQEIQTVTDFQDVQRTGNTLIIAVPLSAPRKLIHKRIEQLLDHKHPGQKGKKYAFMSSQAKYPVHGQFVIPALISALRVYQLRNYLTPTKTNWEIALAAGLVKNVNLKNSKNIQLDEDDRRELTSSYIRCYTRAQNLIKNVGNGIFPKFD